MKNHLHYLPDRQKLEYQTITSPNAYVTRGVVSALQVFWKSLILSRRGERQPIIAPFHLVVMLMMPPSGCGNEPVCKPWQQLLYRTAFLVGCLFDRTFLDRDVPKTLQGRLLLTCYCLWSRIMMSWRITAGEVANRAPLLEQDANRLVISIASNFSSECTIKSISVWLVVRQNFIEHIL